MSISSWRNYARWQQASISDRQEKLYYPIISISANSADFSPNRTSVSGATDDNVRDIMICSSGTDMLSDSIKEEPIMSVSSRSPQFPLLITNYAVATQTNIEESPHHSVKSNGNIKEKPEEKQYEIIEADDLIGHHDSPSAKSSLLQGISKDRQNHSLSSPAKQSCCSRSCYRLCNVFNCIKYSMRSPYTTKRTDWSACRCCLILLFILLVILITIVVTWVVTKSQVKCADTHYSPVVIRGTMRFLVAEIELDPLINSPMARRSTDMTRSQYCRSHTDDNCHQKWYDSINEAFEVDCERNSLSPNTVNTIRDQISSYIIHNSTFCLWHHCSQFDICCYHSSANGKVALIAFTLHMKTRLGEASVTKDPLPALAAKLSNLLLQGSLHYVFERVVYHNIKERVHDLEVCTQQAIIADTARPGCQSVVQCAHRNFRPPPED